MLSAHGQTITSLGSVPEPPGDSDHAGELIVLPQPPDGLALGDGGPDVSK